MVLTQVGILNSTSAHCVLDYLRGRKMGDSDPQEAGEPVVGGPDVRSPVEKALGGGGIQTFDGNAMTEPPLSSVYWSPPGSSDKDQGCLGTSS